MEYIIIIICLVAIVLLKLGFNVHIKDMKKIKEIGNNKELNEIANKFPNNKEICLKILKNLNNKNVEIEEQTESKASFYIAISNKIIIANIKDTFTRIQTIAHECLHSIQNRRILLFNFLFSNVYLLYLVLAAFLIAFNLGNSLVYINIFVGMSIVYVSIRNYLENEAMSKAIFVAKDYMEEYKKNDESISNEDIDSLVQNFDDMNKLGIPLTNFSLILGSIIKIIVLCVISLIF